MKTLNPQPYAVDRINKIKNKPSQLAETKEIKTNERPSAEKTDEEIFQTESEEQAWIDVLKKDLN